MGIHMETAEDLGTCYWKPEVFSTMSAPGDYYDTVHTIAINTRETEFGSIVEPIPITLKTYKQYHMHATNGYFPQQTMLSTSAAVPRVPVTLELRPSTSSYTPSKRTSPAKEEAKEGKVAPPPKKKWIKEYLEEPKSPLPVRVVAFSSRSNGVVSSPPPPLPVSVPPPPTPVPVAYVAAAAAVEPVAAVAPPPPQPIAIEFTHEQHSRPRTTSHGPPQIPSPPSVGSSGSSNSSGATPRAGTREVHNKLEKNRRAHLKECFELLKRQLPATPDDKKTSNLSILGSAIRYIQVLRRKERECEHEMERLAREKIAAQQRLAALKRDQARSEPRPRIIDVALDEKLPEEKINGHVPGIPISVSTAMVSAPSVSQVVGGALTLAALAPAARHHQGGAALVHPAQIHLPISQVGGNVVLGAAALQLLPAALRLLPAPAPAPAPAPPRLARPPALAPALAPAITANGINGIDTNRIPRENGVTSPPGSEGVVVAAPHLVHAHTLTHKMVETTVVSAAGYVSTVVKPLVVVSSPPAPR